MLNRQKAIIALLDWAGGGASRLRLMKWAFLLSREAPNKGGGAFYGFVPYGYGPYSFSMQRELVSLTRDGLLEAPDENTWRLTPAASRLDHPLPPSLQEDVSSVMEEYAHLSTERLLDSVYRRYPWFTVNSKAVWKRARPRPSANPAVYTMGYERLSVEEFLDTLMRSGIRQVFDVRANPVARRYGFHKSTLRGLCHRLDMGYVHLPELGIRSEDRRQLNSFSDYEALFASYRKNLTARWMSSIEDLGRVLRESPGVLVCMEANPALCHRSHLASIVESATGLPQVDLGWPR